MNRAKLDKLKMYMEKSLAKDYRIDHLFQKNPGYTLLYNEMLLPVMH